MEVYDAQRRPIVLATELSRNDESVVYRVQNNTMFLSKLYHTPDDEQAQKIHWMIHNPPYDPNQTCGHTSIAWPHWMLFNKAGDWVGYGLDYVQNGRPMRDVFDPALRARNRFGGKHVYRSAHYIASSLHAIHAEGGYVVGNLNPEDILVTPSSRIVIVAMDVIQVKEKRQGQTILHPARTGKPGYMPPEFLDGRSAAAPLQPTHDLFALGVIIFQLLMDGHHPFEGQWQGPGEPPSLDERIRQGMCPYTADGHPLLLPPPGVSLDTLPPVLADLVRRCFGEGHSNPALRPAALEWESAINQAEQTLVLCQQGHVYANHLAVCPTCGAAVADAKTARRFADQEPEPAALCQPNFPTVDRQPVWLWPVVAGVAVLLIAALLLGTQYMVAAGA